MDYDYNKRGYLLPEGCKDLIDVIKQEAPIQPENPKQNPKQKLHLSFPPVHGEIIVPEQTTVLELAQCLGVAPFQLIGDLMSFGTFANVNEVLDYESISKVAWKYGYRAKKA